MEVGSTIELDPERSFVIAELPCIGCERLRDDGGIRRAVRRWFATMRGSRARPPGFALKRSAIYCAA